MPMATQLGRMMTYLEGLLTIKSYSPLITWSCIVTWQTRILYLRCQTAHSHQTWQDGNLPWSAPTHKVSWLFDCVILRDHATNYKNILTATVPLTTKLGRMLKYLEEFLTMNHLTLWSCGLARSHGKQKLLYPPPECLWLTNLTKWQLTLMGFYLQSHMTLRSRGLVRLLYLRRLYLQYNYA